MNTEHLALYGKLKSSIEAIIEDSDGDYEYTVSVLCDLLIIISHKRSDFWRIKPDSDKKKQTLLDLELDVMNFMWVRLNRHNMKELIERNERLRRISKDCEEGRPSD